jgi:hypothetical protein
MFWSDFGPIETNGKFWILKDSSSRLVKTYRLQNSSNDEMTMHPYVGQPMCGS